MKRFISVSLTRGALVATYTTARVLEVSTHLFPPVLTLSSLLHTCESTHGPSLQHTNPQASTQASYPTDPRLQPTERARTLTTSVPSLAAQPSLLLSLGTATPPASAPSMLAYAVGFSTRSSAKISSNRLGPAHDKSAWPSSCNLKRRATAFLLTTATPQDDDSSSCMVRHSIRPVIGVAHCGQLTAAGPTRPPCRHPLQKLACMHGATMVFLRSGRAGSGVLASALAQWSQVKATMCRIMLRVRVARSPLLLHADDAHAGRLKATHAMRQLGATLCERLHLELKVLRVRGFE